MLARRDVGVQASGRVQVRDGLADGREDRDDLARPQVTAGAHHPGQLGPGDEVEHEGLAAVGEGHDRPERHEVVVLHGQQDLLLGQGLQPVDLVTAEVRHLDRHRVARSRRRPTTRRADPPVPMTASTRCPGTSGRSGAARARGCSRSVIHALMQARPATVRGRVIHRRPDD